MKRYKIFLGIDVSKNSLDCCLQYGESIIEESKLENTKVSILDYLEGQVDNAEQVLICVENTGIYCNKILLMSEQLGFDIWMVNPVHMNRSKGLVRGKTDKMDARRIAQFAYRFQDQAVLHKSRHGVLPKLKELMTFRSRIVKSIKRFRVPVQETREVSDFVEPLVEASTHSIVNMLQIELKKVEAELEQLVYSDATTALMMMRLTSIPGVGKVVGMRILLATELFQKIEEPRKFACYCGVAPFSYQSGTSIKGRTKVSQMADKKTKTLLHLAALAAISGNNDFKKYYRRKVEEGKSKMSVINAVRNKIIHVAFALIKNDTMYQKNHQLNLE